MDNISSIISTVPESCRNATASMKTFQILSLGYVLVEVIIMVFILFGNSLVLVAVWRFEKLRTSINMFVVSLAVSDLTVALLVLPAHIAIYLFPRIKLVFGVCMLRYCSLVISIGTSAITLMLISINRFIAIEMPYEYPGLMSFRRCRIFCVAVWLYSTACASIPFFGWNHWETCIRCVSPVVLPAGYIMFINGHLVIIVVVIGFLNVKIFMTANRVSKEIERQVSDVTDQSYQANKLLAKNKKAATTLVLVFGVYSLCNVPLALFSMWEIYIFSEDPSLKDNIPKWLDILRAGTIFLQLINSGMNPIIYHRKIPEFRKAFRKLLKLKETKGSY